MHSGERLCQPGQVTGDAYRGPMQCLVCHKKVPRLRSWRKKSEFCSDEHAETYRQQTLARLLDECDPPSEVDVPLRAEEGLEEEQEASLASPSSSAESSVEPYQQPDPAQPAEVGPVLADPPSRAHAREDEARVGDAHEHEAEEERVSASHEREDELISSFSDLEATERIAGMDPFERLVALSGEELAEPPSSADDLQPPESRDLPEEPAVIRPERKESDALEPLELTSFRDESLSVLEQVEGETEQLHDIPHLLRDPEQDQAEAPKPEQIAQDTDLPARIDIDRQWSQDPGEQPIGEEVLLSATPESAEEGEVRAPVSTDKPNADLDALLEILNRPSGSGKSVEADSTEPDVDQSVKADSESPWSAEDCRPYNALVNIDELVAFAPDRDHEAQGMRSLGSNHRKAGISGPEDTLGVPRPPRVPKPPQALATDSSFSSVAHVARTHPRTFEVSEQSSGSNQAYEELLANAPQATAPLMPQETAPLTLGSPNLESGHLALLWPTAVESGKQQSEGLDVELRCLPAAGSREAPLSPALGQAISLRPVVQSNTVGRSLPPISLSGGPEGAVRAEAFLPKTVDLGTEDEAPTVSYDEALEISRPLSTTSLPLPRRVMQLNTSYAQALRLPGIAQAEVATYESIPQLTREPALGTKLARQEPAYSEPAKPIPFTLSTVTLGSVRLDPQDSSLPNSVPANLADAPDAHEVGIAAELTEVLPESVQWISLGTSPVAEDTFSETLPKTKHGQPLTLAPEARRDALRFADGADCLSPLDETQSAIPFAWNVIRAAELTTALPRPGEETLEGSTELRADVIVSKVECRLPSMGELRYRLSGRILARFDRLASEESWFARGHLSEATIENAYRAEAEVFSKSTTDDIELWMPPKLRGPVEEFLRFSSSFESVGEMLPSSALEGGAMALGAEEQNEVRPKAGSQAGETAAWNGPGRDAVSSEPVGPVLKVRCPLDPDLWDFS